MKLLSSLIVASSLAVTITSNSNILSNEQISKLNDYTQISDGKMILNIPSNSGLTTQKSNEAQQIINQFNQQASNHDVTIEDASTSQTVTVDPRFGVMRARQYRYYTANGYEYRDSKGHWHYVVTKSPFGVSLHGREGVLGGS